MKFNELSFYEDSGRIIYTEFPSGLRRWITEYDSELDPRFEIDLSDEIPADKFNYIDCWVNRTAQLARLRTYPKLHLETEGAPFYFVREINNIFTPDEVIRFRNRKEKGELGWKLQKSQLIEIDKAITVIEFVIKNLSFPNNVSLTNGWDLL